MKSGIKKSNEKQTSEVKNEGRTLDDGLDLLIARDLVFKKYKPSVN